MTNSVTGFRRAGVHVSADGSATARPGLVIAVDGPSGSGKSSAARGAAVELGLRYLDTGAMYRAVTWWMLEHDVDLADEAAVAKHAAGLTIEIGIDPAAHRVRVDGIDVTAEIRNRRVSNVVSLVAAVPQVRRQLVALQRSAIADAVASAGGIVAEGRDIGTVVAPEAGVKVFLTASEQVRAERRAAELAGRQAEPAGPQAEPAGPQAEPTGRQAEPAGRRAVLPQAGRWAEPPDSAVAASPQAVAASPQAVAASPQAGQVQAAAASADEPPSADLTRAEQALRDRRDAAQSQRAPDAVEIDATNLGLDEVIGRIVSLARRGEVPDGARR